MGRCEITSLYLPCTFPVPSLYLPGGGQVRDHGLHNISASFTYDGGHFSAACAADEPLRALRLLAAGVSPTSSRPAAEPNAEPNAEPPNAEPPPRQTLLQHARASGADLCVELLLQHGAAPPPPPPPVPSISPSPSPTAIEGEARPPVSAALDALVGGMGGQDEPGEVEAILLEGSAVLKARASEAGAAASTVASSAASAAGAALGLFTSSAAPFLSEASAKAGAALGDIAKEMAGTGLYSTFEEEDEGAAGAGGGGGGGEAMLIDLDGAAGGEASAASAGAPGLQQLPPQPPTPAEMGAGAGSDAEMADVGGREGLL